MDVNPISSPAPATSAAISGNAVSSARRAQRRAWAGASSGIAQLSQKERNALLLASLVNPGSLALTNLAGSTSSALAELTNPATLALGNITDPNAALSALGNLADPNAGTAGGDAPTLAMAGLTGAALLGMAGLMDTAPSATALTAPGPAAARSAIGGQGIPAVTPAAIPGYLDATPATVALAAGQEVTVATAATAVSAANAAAVAAAADARDAAATAVQATQSLLLAANAVTAAMAAVTAANAAPSAASPVSAPDPATLGADATAKYLGGGFMGPPAGPGSIVSPSPAGDIPAVGGVPPAPALAANTYSNPQDRSFGQAGPAHTAPMVPAPSPSDGPELDFDA